MDLSFTEMAVVDTSLAQEYLKKNESLLELYNDYNGTIQKYAPHVYAYDGKKFDKYSLPLVPENAKFSLKTTLPESMVLNLRQNATLIAQLEYHIRNIPIEDTVAQLNLIIQHFRCCWASGIYCNFRKSTALIVHPNDSLLAFGSKIPELCDGRVNVVNTSKLTVAICHLIITLVYDAEVKSGKNYLQFMSEDSAYKPDSGLIQHSVKGLDSGTLAVVSDDADVDSAVDKFISVSKQVPWRLRRILVQESVFQQFKDALSWKCNLDKSGDKPRKPDVLCSDALTYNGKTFLIDPFELVGEEPSVVTVEAYRTIKEMISLVQQDKPRYLSLWMNGVAEVNEVTHATKSPVVWVNNVADFRGPPQVSKAVFAYSHRPDYLIKKCDKVAKLCELSQSWLKLDVERRRVILLSVLDKYILLDPANKLYTDIKKYLSTCTLKSFADVDTDYVCIGVSQPMGIIKAPDSERFSLSRCDYYSILQGNAILVSKSTRSQVSPPDCTNYMILEQAGLPVVYVEELVQGDIQVSDWFVSLDSETPYRVTWTNSGKVFAN